MSINNLGITSSAGVLKFQWFTFIHVFQISKLNIMVYFT